MHTSGGAMMIRLGTDADDISGACRNGLFEHLMVEYILVMPYWVYSVEPGNDRSATADFLLKCSKDQGLSLSWKIGIKGWQCSWFNIHTQLNFLY
jgi:hypothetical protein